MNDKTADSAFEGIDDFDELFAKAIQSAEDSGDDSVLTGVVESEDFEPTERAVAEPQVQPIVEPDPTPEVIEEPVVDEILEEPVIQQPVQEPVVQTPAEYTAPLSNTPGRLHIPSEEERISEITRIIAVLDAYRKLTNDEKGVAVQFITGSNITEAPEGVVVSRALGLDKQTAITMNCLLEAWELEPVDLAFYVINLDEETLVSMGKLLAVFRENVPDKTPSISSIEYARVLVDCIAGLGEHEMGFIKSTGSVLAATRM